MLALVLLAFQGAVEPLPIGYDEQLIHSASGLTTLVYRASSYAADPVRLEVLRAGASRWKRAIEWPLELATVDDRGWVAGFRWTGVRFLAGEAPSDAKGRGEIVVFDDRGELAARRLALDCSLPSFLSCGWGVEGRRDEALDVVLLDDDQLLLRASSWVERPGRQGFGEVWSLMRCSDLVILAEISPAEVCRRSKVPLWLPSEWGARGEPALDVRVIPGAPLLAIRWPFPQWRAVEGGVELQEDFTIVDAQARPVLELAQPAMHACAEPDPEFNLAEPRFRTWRRSEWFQARATERFSIVRALDGAWLNYRALRSDGAWRIELEWR